MRSRLHHPERTETTVGAVHEGELETRNRRLVQMSTDRRIQSGLLPQPENGFARVDVHQVSEDYANRINAERNRG
jgi:hypothetical protein